VEEAGHPRVPVSINSHGFIAETAERAIELSYPSAAAMMNRIGRERGWPPLTRPAYEAAATLRGANFVGSPDEVAEKILYQHELFAHDRFLLQLSVGSMPHADMLRAIELYGTEVAPRVRAELARRVPEPAPA
jgi:alkanesulfonate monooxygenase SsuD/methylene tetrahydromethanopterin reductase-like flavin-dependent oxidoreductase (luciferase family)